MIMASERVNEFVTVNKYTSEGVDGTIYYAELQHTGLKEHKVLSAIERPILVNKLRSQLEAWEEQWHRQQGQEDKEEKVYPGEENKLSEAEIQTKIQEAEKQSLKAQHKIEEIKDILLHALKSEPAVDWDSMKDVREYTQVPPLKPDEPRFIGYPMEPDYQDDAFSPKLSWMDKLIKPSKIKKEDKAYKNFQIAYKKWREVCEDIDKENNVMKEKYGYKLSKWEKEVDSWKAKKANFYQEQREVNDRIDQLKQNYARKDPDAILEYCKMILHNASYPETFPKDFTLDFSQHDQTLLLEYAMPSIHDMPILKEVKYFKSKDELSKTYLDEQQRLALYDAALYRVTLRVLYELFQADKTDAIKAIYFNGWIVSVDPLSKRKEKECILSLHATKNEFMGINLSHEDPETCFKELGGVTHAQLSTLTPNEFVMEMNKEEKSVEEPQEEPQHVTADTDEGTNLATMDEEDFEHLIRKILEKEFTQHGGEVHILQGAREGEIHAIAFDPDPIRGGKIVIHGKRSTHPINALEVRELFGNVMKEGASKGILITTSDYEAEARDFAREKPLSLLDGSALLFLLEKHGQKFRIAFNEVRNLK